MNRTDQGATPRYSAGGIEVRSTYTASAESVRGMELWLWSIGPEDWSQGKWRRECRLFQRQGKCYSDADGFHPSGAVTDEERAVQHIFIYSGHPNGPAGVFRIARKLDTAKLTAALGSENR